MGSTSDAQTTEPETVHEGSWSANLEGPEHAADVDRVICEAIEAVEATASGVHVNLVTHADHGHPEEYLYSVVRDRFGDEVRLEYVDQCGCGGYVTRVHVES